MWLFWLVLLMCSVKVVISAKLCWSKYEFTTDTRISNPSSSLTTSTSSACCAMCQMSGTCDIAAYNRESGVCELGKKELAENSTAPGWDLYAAKCPPGCEWEYFDNSCVMLETEELSWTAAQDKCGNKTNGGRLAYVKTEEKNELLISLFTKAYPVGWYSFWIGGTRGESDMFYWGDDTPLSSGFTYWRSGEPNNRRGAENCLSHAKLENMLEFEWNDFPCSSATFSVCEKELN